MIEFHDGAQVDYAPPSSTLDPRYKACSQHRPACDCREAEHAEALAEIVAEQRRVARAVREIVAGHPTYLNAEMTPGCQCCGCAIARLLDSWGYEVTAPEPPQGQPSKNSEAPF